jgi:tRNA(adenine34) deaminase
MDQTARWMRAALQEAQKAYKEDEVPIGAVIVYRERIIGRGHNQVEGVQDPTAHAEILAIGAAAGFLHSWRLEGATIYVTIEPCPMCMGAIILSRLDRLVFGAPDPRFGACGSVVNIPEDYRLNHKIEVTSGVLRDECSWLLSSFFQKLRKVTKST